MFWSSLFCMWQVFGAVYRWAVYFLLHFSYFLKIFLAFLSRFLEFFILCVAGIWCCPVLGVGQLIRTVSATAPQLIHTDSQLHQIYGLFNHFHTFSIARSSQFICMVIIIYEEENTLAYQTFHTFPIFFTTRGLKKKGEGCRWLAGSNLGWCLT